MENKWNNCWIYLYLGMSNTSPDWWALIHNLCFYLVELVAWTLNHFVNLVYYRLLQWKWSLWFCIIIICLRRFSIFCNEKIIIFFFLICFVKLVKPTSIFFVVIFTAKIMIINPCCFSQAVLHNYLNFSLVMSLPTWSSKMWLRIFRSWGNRQIKFALSLIVGVGAWNSFELNRNNQRCCVFLWHNTIHMCFVFQVTDHEMPLRSLSLDLVL